MSLHDRLASLIEPIVTDHGLEVFDLNYAGGTLTLLLQKPAAEREPGAGSGVGIDAITAVTRAVSRALDDADPISAAYSLEVSTPGLERPLRTPAHFSGAVGEQISVKTTPNFDGPRRIKGELLAVTDDAITVQPAEAGEPEPVTVPLTAIDKARTVFEWGPEPKPGSSKSPGGKAGSAKGRAGTGATNRPKAPKNASPSTGPARTAGGSNPVSKEVTSS